MTPAAAGGRDLPLPRVVLAGAGQMGGALLAAWIDAGLPASSFAVAEPHPSEALRTRLAHAGIGLQDADDRPEPADVLVLAVKPQVVGDAAAMLGRQVGPSTLLLSVAAGKTIGDLRRLFPQAGAIARAMPNTPASIRRGITGVTAEPAATPAQRAVVDRLLGAVGQVEWVADERLIDAVTAVSGSGPAYVFYMVECLAKAGVELGLKPDAALRLARATVEGAGALLAARPDDEPGVLRRNVTSPGGTTAAALEVLMRDDALPRLMAEAAAAANRRAVELAG